MKSIYAKRMSAAICAAALGATITAAGAQQTIRTQRAVPSSPSIGSRAAAAAGSLLYVSSETPADIAICPSSAAGRTQPIATITGPHTGLIRPNGIAVDQTRTSYVVNAPNYKQTGSVTIVSYGNGDVTRKGFFTCFLFDPWTAALDTGGVHITDLQYNAVSTYKPGEAVPISGGER